MAGAACLARRPIAEGAERREHSKEPNATNIAATTPPPGTTAAGPPDLWVWPFTDLGNARRLVRAFGADIRFLAAAQAWLVWDGRR